MQYIKGEYIKRYKKSLNDAVRSESIAGHFLLSLLAPDHWILEGIGDKPRE